MPISSQVPIIGYVANGVTKSFAFPFAILSVDDLKVKVDADVVTAGFSIAGVGDRDGGSVTFTDAPASLTPIILYREVTLDRTTDYQENGDLLAIVLDDDLDRIWMALQDQLLLSDRALRSPIGETLQQLPPASERALMALAFDAAGNPIVVRGTNDGGAALALDLMDTAPGKGAALVGYGSGTVADALDEVATALEAAAPITTQGDLVVGGAGGIPARLPKGVDGKVLKMVSGAPAWGDVAGGGASDAASVTNENGGTVQDVIGVSIKGKGGVGDGVTSDQASVADAIASGFESVLVNDNGKFLVTSLTNPRGVELDGHGHIVKAITGGLQKLNSYSDKSQYVFGREYLAAFHNLLIAQSTTPTRKPIMVFSGDSTTAGDAVSADYQIDDLLKLAGEVAGLQTAYGLSSINRGQSGKNTEQWRATYLAGDLAANPDLLVLRWGVNDPGYYSADPNTGPAAGAGQAAAGRRTVDDFLTSLRSGLATIRASRNVASLSIVLMTPNSTSDTPNARDELWYEQIIPGIKQAARDYQCTFIDTYAYLRDSRHAAGVWMDNPFGDGRAIHPLNVMNMWIAGMMADVIFPTGLRDKIGVANIRNTSGADDVGDAARLPSYYRLGITISRAYQTTSAWPVDGSVITVRSLDLLALQINYSHIAAYRGQLHVRMGGAPGLAGGSDSWGSWFTLSGSGGSVSESSSNVTPSSGFALPASGVMRAAKTGSMTVLEGYITKSAPGVIASGTIVAVIPAGYRPAREAIYTLAQCWDGSAWESVRVVIGADGNIATMQATTLNTSRIYINATFSQLA